MAMGRKHRRRKGEAGFSLLEISAALFVITVGLLGVFQTYHYGLTRGRAVAESALVRQALQNEIETLRTLPFDELAPGDDLPLRSEPPRLAKLAHCEGGLHIAPVAGHEGELVEVTARIHWRGDRGRRIEQSLTTYIARIDGGVL